MLPRRLLIVLGYRDGMAGELERLARMPTVKGAGKGWPRRLMSGLMALRHDSRGAMAIETAIIVPVLVLMGIGSFQISSMVARQTELQSAAAEAAAIALASPPESQAELNTVRDIMMVSTGLPQNHVEVSMAYRCGNAATRVSDPASCAEGTPVWKYMHLRLTDTYEPIWRKLGVGSDVNLAVDRAVQIS